MFKRLSVLMLTLCIVLALPVLAQDDDPAAAALAFLKTVQNADGGISNGFDPTSDTSTTADAVVAIAVAGLDPNAFLTGDLVNPLLFLAAQVNAGNVTDAGTTAKVLTAAIAAGKDPAGFSDHDLVGDLLALQADDGLFGFGAYDHCLSMIALQNAGAELPDGAVDALLGVQGEDGGWGFMAGEASDTNTTGLCLQALALTGEVGAVEAGLAYLAAIQNEDGGWPYQNPSDYGTDSDTNSTALVVQALVANGEELADWNSPQEWLLSMQNDSGSFSFQAAMPGDNVLATVAVIPAIEGVPLNAWAPVPEAE
ncbi:MAG: terpene cyclase/mutase family protein [Anaerolineae bacterium]|nr:terpene cyclase/mutase family protein [Anaerolineae bacterium]